MSKAYLIMNNGSILTPDLQISGPDARDEEITTL